MPFNSGATTSIQQQLSADWDNREFNYVISEYVKRISDTVGQFYLSSQNKLATLNDKVTRLERKVEFLEANLTLSSRTPEQARLGVLQVYKNLQKITPKFWFDFHLIDIPLPVFRNVLKNEFTKNAHHTDIRIIDRKVAECYKDIEAIQMAYYNPEHVRNYLFRENIDPKAKDFLSQFLSGS
ncbi:Complex 1 LYR protein and Methyltransferase type 11 domain containing protein [Aphelenchoides besseyi]|nr:Complex 1 LYR protein and Methyltransferase type 11 domain containing protein [Aphelenchoides besseyi]